MQITITFDSIDEYNDFLQVEAQKIIDARTPKDPILLAFELAYPELTLSKEDVALIRRHGPGLESIKVLRAATGLGLKQAKDFLEAQGLGLRAVKDTV